MDFWVPYRTYQKHNPMDDENFVSAEAYPGQVDAAEDEIRGVLRLRRQVPYDKPDTLFGSRAPRNSPINSAKLLRALRN